MDETENIIVIPHEDREIIVLAEDRDIVVPAEWRVIEIRRDQPMLINSKAHTAGSTIRWKVDYDRWLDNAAEITGMQIASSAADLGVTNIQMLGRHIYFLLNGGSVNEQVTLTLSMSDNFQNVKKDTIQYTVVAP